jgi:hypothetical protein
VETATSSEQTKPTLHAFPLHDQQLTKEWLKAIHREDFAPTDKSRLCSLHFYPSDFVCERQQLKAKKEATIKHTLKAIFVANGSATTTSQRASLSVVHASR